MVRGPAALRGDAHGSIEEVVTEGPSTIRPSLPLRELIGRMVRNNLQTALVTTNLRFAAAQTVATLGAITWNFALNNAFTYRDQRLTGLAFVTGLVRFQIICAVGAVSNVGVATWIYAADPDWWIAGLGGALMGAVWNYVVSAAFVWRQR